MACWHISVLTAAVLALSLSLLYPMVPEMSRPIGFCSLAKKVYTTWYSIDLRRWASRHVNASYRKISEAIVPGYTQKMVPVWSIRTLAELGKQHSIAILHSYS